MKKVSIIFIFLCVLLVGGCHSENKKIELKVFAASSLSETLSEIAALYQEVEPNVSIVFNFDSSGTLKTQIEEGAECDLFISAAQKQMNELDNVMAETRIDLLENKVALAVANGNPKNIQSYQDMVKRLKVNDLVLAIGNSDVPVGQYTQKIFTYFDLSETDLSANGCITYGSNVKEVTTQVSESLVDCGIIYQTDAYSAKLTVVDEATLEMCGQVIYPAAVLEDSNYQEAAKAFLTYLTTAEASSVFEKVGFTPLK